MNLLQFVLTAIARNASRGRFGDGGFVSESHHKCQMFQRGDRQLKNGVVTITGILPYGGRVGQRKIGHAGCLNRRRIPVSIFGRGLHGRYWVVEQRANCFENALLNGRTSRDGFNIQLHRFTGSLLSSGGSDGPQLEG